MAVKLTLVARTSLAQSIIDKLDAGLAAGMLKIYDGVQPTGPDTPITSQNVLADHNLSYPCGVAANGVLTFSAISEDSFANATGTAVWARLFDSNGLPVADASITQVGGGGDLQMNTVNIVINGPIRFTSLQWTMPGA
jgi:hypothetical protein